MPLVKLRSHLPRAPLATGAVALIAFVVAAPAFGLLAAHSKPHYSLSRAAATRVALADPKAREPLHRYGYTSVRVSPLDDRQQRVSFFDGAHLVLHAAVGPAPR